MNSTTTKEWSKSPLGAFTVVAATIFLSEFAIMVLIERIFTPLLDEKYQPWFWGLIDSVVLSVIVAPVLYFLLLRPLMQQSLYIKQQAANLVIANKEQAFQIEEKGKRADELVIANKELAFQIEEKGKRADEFKEVKKESDSVRELAFYDALTSLPNRRLLNDRLTQAMSASKRSDSYNALLFLDLDNFKPLNDKFGHGVGDLLLIEVASRLKSCVREIDTVARIGGDEFVVLLCELNTVKADSNSRARIISEKIHASLSEPYLLNLNHKEEAVTTVEHRCTASIGVVVFTNHEVSHNTILERADLTMYKAKEAGRNQIQFYE